MPMAAKVKGGIEGGKMEADVRHKLAADPAWCGAPPIGRWLADISTSSTRPSRVRAGSAAGRADCGRGRRCRGKSGLREEARSRPQSLRLRCSGATGVKEAKAERAGEPGVICGIVGLLRGLDLLRLMVYLEVNHQPTLSIRPASMLHCSARLAHKPARAGSRAGSLTQQAQMLAQLVKKIKRAESSQATNKSSWASYRATSFSSSLTLPLGAICFKTKHNCISTKIFGCPNIVLSAPVLSIAWLILMSIFKYLIFFLK